MTDQRDLVNDYMETVRDENYYQFYHTSFSVAKASFPTLAVDGGVLLLKDFDEKQVVYPKPAVPRKAFKAFLRLHEFAIVDDCSERAMKTALGDKQGRVGMLLLYGDESNTTEWEREFHKLATSMRSKDYVFIFSGVTDGACKKYAEDFLVTEGRLPALHIVQLKNNELQRFDYNGSFTVKAMSEFITEWKEGRAPRLYKSEEVPEENPGPVYKVVGDTFQDEVINSPANVFVKFYAPWCGHCKSFAPLYTQIAEKFKGNKLVKFVDIDATKNEIPGTYIQSFPTLKFYPANAKQKPIPYDGPRTVDTLEKFVLENMRGPASNSTTETKSDL